MVMGTKIEVMKPKRRQSFGQITKLKPKPRCFTVIISTPFYPWLLAIFFKLRQNVQGNMIWKWRMLRFWSVGPTKPNVKFRVCEVTKQKLKPKLFPSHETEGKAEALGFWYHEAEAEALTWNASASRSWRRSQSSFVPMSEIGGHNYLCFSSQRVGFRRQI